MNKTEIIDNVEKSINGSQSAITALYNYTYSDMHLLAYNLCRNEDIAEDILQESYITAFTNLNKLRNKGSFEFWLKGILINEWRRHIREDKRSVWLSIDDVNQDQYDENFTINPTQALVERKETQDELWRQVNTLPENQRICVILFYYHDMSIEEIANILNIPKGSVKSRLYYGKLKLKKYLDGKEISLNSIVYAPIIGEGSESLLAKILTALDTTAKGTASVAIKTVGTGIFLKVGVGIIFSIAAVGLTGVIINLPKNLRPEPHSITFSTTAAAIETTTTTTSSAVSTTAVTTQTTTDTAAETVTFDYKAVNGGIQLTQYTGNSRNVTIPESIDGKTVVSIGNSAFQQSNILQSVAIPSTVKSIGSNAFRDCVNLTSVSLGGANTIGDAAFLGCTSLKKVNLPRSVRSVGIYAFAHCSSLTEVKASEGLELLNYCAFYNCPNLSKVTLPASLTQIGQDAFASASGSLTIYAVDGSYSQEYAEENGISVVLVG